MLGLRRTNVLLALLLSTTTMWILAGSPATATGGSAPAVSPGAVRAMSKPVPPRPPDAVDPASGPRIVPKPGGQHATISRNAHWIAVLAAHPGVLWPGQYATLTARTNRDLAAGPYYLNIYNTTTDVLVASCGAGITCSASVTETTAKTDTFIALVTDYSLAYPPTSIQASSRPVRVLWRSISVSLTASPTTLGVGGKTRLVATADADIGRTPFYIEIFDDTTGALLAACASGASCTTTTSQPTAQTHSVVAYVASYSTVEPTAYQAVSATSYVTWSPAGYTLSLSLARQEPGSMTAQAVANMNVGTNYIDIYDETSDTVIVSCTGVSVCSQSFTPSARGDDLVAFVTDVEETSLPSSDDILASSNVAFMR